MSYVHQALYRGLRKANDEWVTGYLWNGASCSYIIPHNAGILHDSHTDRMTATAYEVRKESIGRRLDIMDRAFNTLYEYDILQNEKGEIGLILPVELHLGMAILWWRRVGDTHLGVKCYGPPNGDSFIKVGDAFKNREKLEVFKNVSGYSMPF